MDDQLEKTTCMKPESARGCTSDLELNELNVPVEYGRVRPYASDGAMRTMMMMIMVGIVHDFCPRSQALRLKV